MKCEGSRLKYDTADCGVGKGKCEGGRLKYDTADCGVGKGKCEGVSRWIPAKYQQTMSTNVIRKN